jgi:hypothetical protein
MRGPSKHTIETELHVKIKPAGLVDFEAIYPVVVIEYEYMPGSPAYTPRGEFAPIDPPIAPECRFLSAKLVRCADFDPTPAQVEEWSMDWLDSEEGFSSACYYAELERREWR